MKSNIAFVTGGFTGESVVSLASAAVVAHHLDTTLFNIYKIVISRESWLYTDVDGKNISVDKNDFTLTINQKKIKFDCAFIMLHGSPGEDGKLQGYLDMLEIPYTTCNAATSALTMNKRYTVATAAFAGIKVAKSLHLFKKNALSTPEILNQLKLPVFVKPNSGGSSIGMSKVNTAAALPEALEKAFREDDEILVEEFIKGREFTVGVVRLEEETTALPIIEIVSNKEFFDYEAKYTVGVAHEIIPAPINEEMTNIIKETAIKIYRLFNCAGIIRVDFIWNELDNQPYMLEINTVPGQTENSLVPQEIREYGWTMKDFYTRLIKECIK